MMRTKPNEVVAVGNSDEVQVSAWASIERLSFEIHCNCNRDESRSMGRREPMTVLCRLLDLVIRAHVHAEEK